MKLQTLALVLYSHFLRHDTVARRTGRFASLAITGKLLKRNDHLASHLHSVVLAPYVHLSRHTLHMLDMVQAVVAIQLFAVSVGGFCQHSLTIYQAHGLTVKLPLYSYLRALAVAILAVALLGR